MRLIGMCLRGVWSEELLNKPSPADWIRREGAIEDKYQILLLGMDRRTDDEQANLRRIAFSGRGPPGLDQWSTITRFIELPIP